MTAVGTAVVTLPPLSVAQEALWYASLLAPNRITYNEVISIRKQGPLDVDALRRAFSEIVARHQAWRSTFDTVKGEPVQIVRPPVGFELPVLDLSHLSPEQAEAQAVRLVGEVARVPYDIRHGPLLRPRLIRFPGQHHRLYLALHHLIFDGASVNRAVLPELVALYDAYAAGRPSPLPGPAGQYGDFARWERDWITQPRVVRRLEHWQGRLQSLPTVSLPLDHPRPDVARSRGGMLGFSVERRQVDGLRALGCAAGATLFQALAATWALLLGRYSGQHEVVFATVADLRGRPELLSVVGYGVTPVVLRVDLGGEPTVAELLLRVRNEVLDALDHLLPFERIVRQLPAFGSSSANPIYQTMVVLEPEMVSPDPCWTMHQLESEAGDAVANSKVDLELQLDQRPEGDMEGRLIYDRDLFERDTARRLVDHWLMLVQGAVADPAARVADLGMLTAGERHRQVVEWNATATERAGAPLAKLARRQAEFDPDAPALAMGGETISRTELLRLAQSATGGTRPDADSLVGDTWTTAAQVAGVLRDPPPGAAALASTLVDELGLGPADVVLVLPRESPGSMLPEVCSALVAGARMVIAPVEIAADGAALSKLIASEGVTFLHASPGRWQGLIDTGLRPARGLKVLTGGGLLSGELAARILERCRVLWHGYVDAATGGYCTLGRVEASGPVTVGRPIANTRVYVLDAHDQLVPVGVWGELIVAGGGAVRGGADRAPVNGLLPFIAEPARPGTAVRTGQCARWLADGRLQLGARAKATTGIEPV